MTFRESISAIPFRPASSDATGFLAPIIRASGHILYVTAALAAVEDNGSESYHLTDEEIHRELSAATGHLARTTAVAAAAPISTACKNIITEFVRATRLAVDEYAGWEAGDRGNNIKDLADRAAALGAFLDGELANVTGSDPGRTL